MNNPNENWWQSLNQPEPYDPNASSTSDDWKFSLSFLGVIALTVGSVIWLIASIL